MPIIVGVRFRNAGKVYYFDPRDMKLRRGDRVIVETARGMEIGQVALSPREVPKERLVSPLLPVLRRADARDLEREAENRRMEKEAYRICRGKIREHGLQMQLVQAEYAFDRKKLLFYFTADGRVDFRDLVKDLASVFKMRIELRQIGVRDETRMLGGIGICGRPLCCSTYLSDFAPVSIRMAKEQNLSLNPAKISGVCGRLMCCLKNEQETYEYLNKQMPGLGDKMATPEGRTGEVQAVNVLKQTVRLLIEDGDNKEVEEHPAADLTLVEKRKKGASRAGARRERDDAAGGRPEGRGPRGENRKWQEGPSGRPPRRERRAAEGAAQPEGEARADRPERIDRAPQAGQNAENSAMRPRRRRRRRPSGPKGGAAGQDGSPAPRREE